MKKILYIPAALVLLVAACTSKPKDKKAELADLLKQQSEINGKVTKLQSEVGSADSGKTTDVSTVAIKTSTFTNYVQIQGKIDAQDNVTAYSQSPGNITAIFVKVGQHVSKGQVLAQLDNSALRQTIAQSEAQVSLNQTLYDRQKNLWDQKIGTEVQFLQAQTSLQASKKALSALREQAAMYRITSPINGTVDQMDLKLGQVIQPGQPGTGIRIVNADVLKVKADVPESYSGSVNTGNDVKILVPDANDSLVTKVTFAAKVIDPTSRSFGVEIKLPVRKTLRPNMTAIIQIANYTKANTIAIPVKAIQKSEEGDYVLLNANGIAKRVNVKSGGTYGGQTEILSGLKAGDQLITDGATDIEDGDKIKVLNAAN
ncbi:efflux RND transporter periplasmic adaptor subunit [Mucilaginibacter ginsenosidivorax]|uniref:Efflux RND transporter periplasmic adaptor subunit n=1 Tax=Mucilaginibacter ginsenosidivorax TaxID=862126 RepID=A0A5B8VSY0_9SPHI|nr:efflux RND transporter periplasmic adaptor subunit [Mucilaginibacter ginsenosidivorax]QEC74549.1 efflux RND transporter periplasmic adaptor subunit [Mucilaginibacter ginsenosidivorax]